MNTNGGGGGSSIYNVDIDKHSHSCSIAVKKTKATITQQCETNMTPTIPNDEHHRSRPLERKPASRYPAIERYPPPPLPLLIQNTSKQ